MKRLLCCFLSIFTLSAGSSMALAEDTVDKAVTLPTLVQCQSEKDCDRNPQHFEQFVIDFYRWYINDKKIFFALAEKKLSEQRKRQAIHEFSVHQKQVLIRSLSPAFREWRNKILSVELGDAPINPKYCEPDVDFILCTQDWGTYDMSNASTQLLSVDDKNATILISIPLAIKSDYSPPRQLWVHMLPGEGTWQIDAISDRVSSPHNDK